MKLSMWMIANRLYNIDMEICISENDPIKLKSARRVYATDCIYVYAEDKDVVCQSDAGTIKLKDITLSQGFEIIQDVFDFYEDWYCNIRDLMNEGRYQDAIDCSWKIFYNPVILLDGNSRVLGMTSYYHDNPPDNEWIYLKEYGHSSIQAIQYMRTNFPNKNFGRKQIQSFQFSGKVMNNHGITCGIINDDVLIGRLTLMEKDRKINNGDYQTVKLFVDCFLIAMQKKTNFGKTVCQSSVFYQMLIGEPVEKSIINRQLAYKNWNEDDLYQVILIRINREPLTEQILDLMEITLKNKFPNGQIVKHGKEFILIWNISRSDINLQDKLLEHLILQTGSVVSKSLHLYSIHKLSYLYIQAQDAIQMAEEFDLTNKNNKIINFYNLAMDYMVLSGDLEKNYYVCHPDVMMLWEREKKHRDGLFDTFSVYMEYDCSVKATAEVLFVHRNTLLYRIQKCMKMFKSDINDSYTKSYMKLSLRVLKLYENRIKNRIEKTDSSR